jgi:hypothetical protein
MIWEFQDLAICEFGGVAEFAAYVVGGRCNKCFPPPEHAKSGLFLKGT